MSTASIHNQKHTEMLTRALKQMQVLLNNTHVIAAASKRDQQHIELLTQTLQQTRLLLNKTHDTKPVNVHEWQKNMRKRGWAMPAVYVGDMYDSDIDSRWTSQVGQDKTIVRLFKNKHNGFFIDLAANHAVRLSNTLTLEQMFDWSGVCIEANPQYYEKLYHRKCQLVQGAVGATDNERVYFKFKDVFGGVIIGESFDNKESGGGDQVQTVATVSLKRLFTDLSVPHIIDYMSLDIEGAEEWVFDTFPWNEYTILCLTVERPKEKLINSLKTNGYVYVCNHGDFGDQLWLHSSFPDRQAATDSLGLNGGTTCSG